MRCNRISMRLFLIFLMPMILFAGQPWSTQDKVLEGAFAASLLADWSQTRDIANHNDLHETNPILGEHPGNGRINRYFLASLALHAFVADRLDGKWRTAWQCVWIGAEVGTVEHNYNLGLRFKF